MQSTTIFMRETFGKQWSIERVFRDVFSAMPSDSGVNLVTAPYTSVGIWNRLKLLMWARRKRSQVNHISGDFHFLTFVLPSKRTILTVHDCERLTQLSGLKRWLFKKIWFDWPTRRTGHVTAISTFTKNDLVRVTGCNPDKISVIPNPVSPEFTPSSRSFERSCPRILHVGTRPNKNLENVAPALKAINCTLVIVGELSQPQRVLLAEHQIKFENHVGVSDAAMIELYQGCDLVLFASIFEGFGLIAVEGQACGKPVITSTGEPFEEVVAQSACRVDPNDVAAIREGVEKVINDPSYRAELVTMGFENVLRFKPETIAQKYLSLYARINPDS